VRACVRATERKKSKPEGVRFRFRTPLNLNRTESPVLLGSGSRFGKMGEPDRKSGSRSGEICPEPDRTGLRQHYVSLAVA
jgi:hypothetical protein